MTDTGTHFSLIFTGLRAVIAALALREPARIPFFVFLHSRLGRTIRRFQNLYARWRNGSLPTPRIRALRPAVTRERRPPAFRAPEGRAWLLRQLQHHHANAARSQLQHFLTTTELREFLAAAPQAARILRPLCQMLGVSFDKPTGVPLPPLPAKPERTPPPCPGAAAPDPPSHTSPIPPTPFSPA